ncbi:MAG TPA: hypothetical protein VHX38_11670 [Pseudonocardiaceae bacterium]|jgi:DMSO/TMAO reductase YedYZ molybdopterin-dependent catalytic subunit|nr:hypothetical protein [Pseudonocardiaceae bacterium]
MPHRILAATALIIGVVGITAAHATSATAAPAKPAPALAAVSHQAAPQSAYPLRCVVTASNVNYRRGPGTQYASFGQMNRGYQFDSDGGVPNPRSRLQYWDTVRRPGRADAYVDDAYVYCWLA